MHKGRNNEEIEGASDDCCFHHDSNSSSFPNAELNHPMSFSESLDSVSPSLSSSAVVFAVVFNAASASRPPSSVVVLLLLTHASHAVVGAGVGGAVGPPTGAVVGVFSIRTGSSTLGSQLGIHELWELQYWSTSASMRRMYK